MHYLFLRDFVLRAQPRTARHILQVTRKHYYGSMLGDSCQLQFFQILLKAMSAKRHVHGMQRCGSRPCPATRRPGGCSRPSRDAGQRRQAALEGDELLREGQAGTFDFVFIDADKEHYDEYYERSLLLVRRNGLIVIDNVLWRGTVYDPSDHSSESVALRAFNTKLHQDERVDICLLPLADGVTFARKK
ncbi:hypothetical protein HPB48_021851 [Haemaphysalis longicornis]|uniref:O-methyltransferase n=1 Tax=Haemaphysalis longicornis TaxID=44386 RepID=A0A9J6H1L7_HAELO|nr:hypothetical protein HPB48_021851 [Haemaphysalis longicornis]